MKKLYYALGIIVAIFVGLVIGEIGKDFTRQAAEAPAANPVKQTGAVLYGVLRVSSPSTPLVTLNVKTDVGSEKLCNVLIETTWAALQPACTDCVLDVSSCTTELNPEYLRAVANKQIVATYLTRDKERIVFLGVTPKQGLEICETMAKQIRELTGKPADCILGSGLRS